LRDVLVVGGGPAGLIAGAEAAHAGADVLILEEDQEAGRPDHCAGLVSRSGLTKLIEPSPNFILEWIKGVRIYSPSGRVYDVMTEETKACIIDRTKFDKELLRRAEASGAEVMLGKTYPQDITDKPKVVVDAEGIKGRCAKVLGFDVPQSIPAAQMDLEVADFDRDVVEMYTGNWAPGFFAWKVPRKDHVRIGLACYKGVPMELLQRMLEKNPNVKAKNAKVLNTIYGKVVVSGPLRRTVQGNAMLIGDAGGFAKPTTGGGVVLGGLIARIAGKAAADSAIREMPLESFQTKWRKDYGREFRSMKLAGRIFRNMKGDELERALKVSHEAGILGIIAGYDFDLQHNAVNRVLESRLIRFCVLPFLRSIV
jgi:geranylgeranyl reductase family protein